MASIPPTPRRTQAAVAAWATPWTSEAPTSTRLRGRRSERTPPPTTTSAWTPCRTAKTTPSAVAEAMSSTAKVSAMPAMRSPAVVIVVAPKSSRKSRSRSAPRRSRSGVDTEAEGSRARPPAHEAIVETEDPL